MALLSNKDDALVAVLSGASLPAGINASPGRSLWADARRRFLRNRAAVVSLVVLLLVATACVSAPGYCPTHLTVQTGTP